MNGRPTLIELATYLIEEPFHFSLTPGPLVLKWIGFCTIEIGLS